MSNGFDKLAAGIGNAIQTVPELYHDAFQPAAQETGKFIARIPHAINAAFASLDIWILNKEYNIEETKKLLAQKLEHVNPEKIVTPEAYVAVPAIQFISYSMNSDELRDLYTNLLAKAMNADTKESVHPAYLETIKQLSPDDASYFKHIASMDFRPMIDVVLEFPNALQKTIAENANLFSKGHVKNLDLSIDNLSRLGLINIPNGVWYGDNSLYEPLVNAIENKYTFESFLPDYPNALNMTLDKKRIDITSYGHSFFETCVL